MQGQSSSGQQTLRVPLTVAISRAESVRAEASSARSEAEAQLAEAEKVTNALSEASEAQARADASVQAAQANIDQARKDLAMVDGKMDEAVSTADESVLGVAELAASSQPLQTDFMRNEVKVTAAREAAAKAKEKASAANAVLYQLNNAFKNVSATLDDKTRVIGGAKDLAVDLQKRANDLATSATNKLASIYGKVVSPVAAISIVLVVVQCVVAVFATS